MAPRSLAGLLGTSLPVIQAPMAGVQGHALALAVSRAGGLGSLPCAMLSPEAIRSELTLLRAGTDRPFAVNFFCHRPPAPDARREQVWRAALAPYAAELGIDLETAPPGAGRTPFSEALCDLIEPFRPPVLSFHFGLPAPGLLARVKAWGAVVLSSATTVEEARWLEAHGADAVIAQGLEAGGHRGHFLGADADASPQLGLFALLPQVARAVRVPVVAAGGIAGPQEVAAARALGAAGVQAGTAFLLCPEATTPALHRAALREATAQSFAAAGTALTNVFTGRPARALVNRLLRERGPMSAEVPAFPLAAAVLAPLRAAAEAQGRADFTPLWAGCRADACREIPAAELTRHLSAGWA
jgi:nitronate monooxygenase